MAVIELKMDDGDNGHRAPHEGNEKVLSTLAEMKGRFDNGEDVYVKLSGGDRDGTIALIKKFEELYVEREDSALCGYSGKIFYGFKYYADFEFMVGFDDRKNHLKVRGCYNQNNPDETVVYLPDYHGPTVCRIFDKKAAAKEAAETQKVYDMNGIRLEGGQDVVYINARYGRGMKLCNGVIDYIDFKVSASGSVNALVYVSNVDDEEEISKIKNPSEFIMVKM